MRIYRQLRWLKCSRVYSARRAVQRALPWRELGIGILLAGAGYLLLTAGLLL